MSGNTDFFPIERNRYFYGKLLTVRDFEMEQRYTDRKVRLLSRFGLGTGVVCGLGVKASDDSTLLIESGLALDYQGRLLTLEQSALRKLQMLDGYDEIQGKDSAYLCMRYQETDQEPVNAVGASAGESRQFNMTREGVQLYLTAQTPEYRGLLEAQGRENVTVLYSSADLTLVLSVPSAVCGGREFAAEVLVVKNENTPPIHFRLEGESRLAESENGRVALEFQESPEERRRVYATPFRLRAKAVGGTEIPLFPSGGELDLSLGSHSYKNYVEIDARCRVCRDEETLEQWREETDSLDRRLRGLDTPLYLAKLELIQSSGSVFLASVTNLPFRQRLTHETAANGEGGLKTVTTAVRNLEYWQKPDVKATFQPSAGALHLDFGIPSPEQYDYAVSHGTVELTMPGGLRVNSRVFSDEIEHGLGPGAVDVRLSLQFADPARDGETALFFGNTEVFKGKQSPVAPPWVEYAALVYPERGTMRIGLWLHDMVEGNRLTVHFFAQKPERDTSRILESRKVSVSVMPEFSRVSRRGRLQLQAEVTGSEDTAVLWSVREENGGAVDRNGIYEAPELPGTYEITATARADETAAASAFVVVE